MIENLVLGEKYKGGPVRKTHCKYGHSMDDSIQKFTKEGRPNGRVCRTCRADQQKIYRERYPELVYKGRTNFQLRSRYGIKSIEERESILKSQGGKCAICETSDCHWGKGFTKVWHIDHDHNNKNPNHRAIVCSDCNLMLGSTKDNPELLRKMADYIESHTAGLGI